MADTIKINKGLDIKINGKAVEKITGIKPSGVLEINPDYYHGIIPKLIVTEGDVVKAGSPLFFNKNYGSMNFVSPVSGKIREIVRGERRKIMRVVIDTAPDNDYLGFDIKNIAALTSVELKNILLASGLWAFIRQRPYDIIADPDKTPKAIFISAFDSAPLAPDNEFVMNNRMDDFQVGVDMLAKLSGAEIHIGMNTLRSIFANVKGVRKTVFEGVHPAGNVGVHINHINPVNRGETVWTLSPQDVAAIGRLFTAGIVDMTRIVALTGPEVANPQYFETIAGNSISDMIKGNLKKVTYPLRYISGNVLTGTQIAENGYLSPYDTQISVIDEGSETHELFGWAMPRLKNFSSSNLYFSKILPRKNYKYDARLLGGTRSIIMSGEWDRVFPMDILPEYLIKAMIAHNVDRMENLGAYEVAPEDFALCEFVDTSKLQLQAIVREALDYLKTEAG